MIDTIGKDGIMVLIFILMAMVLSVVNRSLQLKKAACYGIFMPMAEKGRNNSSDTVSVCVALMQYAKWM